VAVCIKEAFYWQGIVTWFVFCRLLLRLGRFKRWWSSAPTGYMYPFGLPFVFILACGDNSLTVDT